MSGYTVAGIAGAVAGVGVAVAALKARGSLRNVSLRDVPPVVAVIVAIALAGSMLVTVGHETKEFVDAGQSEVGRLPPPMPEAMVAAARKALRPGETWTLFTPDGRCRDDATRFYLLAFRLLPNTAECTKVPTVIVTYRVADPQDFGTVVAQGNRWAVIRP